MRVGVLMGGWNSEREVSLASGKSVTKALIAAGYRAVQFDLTGADRNGKRLREKMQKARLDAAFIVLHGGWGEDGGCQALLEGMGLPYTGPGPLACGLAMQKACAKLVFEANGIPTAPWQAVHRKEYRPAAVLQDLKVRLPLVVKPADSGSAVGVSLVKQAKDLPAAFRKAFKESPWALVEKYLSGVEVTVGVLGREALPVIEIVPQNEFYDYDAKYTPGHSQHLLPARLPAGVRRRVQQLALKAGESLGCEGYWRADFIVPRKGKAWGEPQILEVNTVPGFTDTSLFPEAAKAVGYPMPKLVRTLVTMAVKGRKTKGKQAA